MKYELQFTVKPDAVKQNRKLPEIAFFDTDGNPISFGGGGGSVDLTHLTELAFGDDSLTELRLFTDAEAEGYYATQGTGLLLNRTLVIDDPDYNGVMVVNSDAWPVESDYEQAGSTLYVGHNGGNVAAWAPDTVHPGNYERTAIGSGYGFTRVSGLPTDKFLNAYVGIEANPRFKAEIDGSMHWGDGTAAPNLHLHPVDPTTPVYGWMPALQMDNGLVIADPDWDGLLVIDPDDHTGNQTWVAPGDVNVKEGTGATNASSRLTHQGLTILGEYGNVSLYGGFGGDDSDGVVSLSAYDSRLYIKQPADHGLGAIMIDQPGDTGGFGQESFRVDHDGTLHWGAEGSAVDTVLQRTAPGTLEIDNTLSFKGDASDPTSGQSLRWDQDWYGLTLTGKVGSGDASMYFLNVDNSTVFGGIWPGGMAAVNGENRVIINAVDHSLIFKGDGVFTRLHYVSTGVLEIEPPEGPGHSALRLHSPDGSLFDVSVANDGTLSAVAV